MNYTVDLNQILLVLGLPFVFLGLRFIFKWFLMRVTQLLSETDPISTVLASFSMNLLGIEFLLFCFSADIIYLVGSDLIITEDHLIANWSTGTMKTLGIFITVHVSLLFVFALITLVKIIKPELQKKSGLIYDVIILELLAIGPVEDFFDRVNKTTNAGFRHIVDCTGFVILLITLVLLFGKVR